MKSFSSISNSIVKTFIERLNKVDLHDNPWDCACAVQSLQEFMLHKYEYRRELHYDETLCDKPELLVGQPLHRVHHINDCAIFFGATYGLTEVRLKLVLAKKKEFSGQRTRDPIGYYPGLRRANRYFRDWIPLFWAQTKTHSIDSKTSSRWSGRNERIHSGDNHSQ
jgi:hypothetical protein